MFAQTTRLTALRKSARESEVRRFNNARRAENCRASAERAQEEDESGREPFMCELGTLWCTEAHGEWELYPLLNGEYSHRSVLARLRQRLRKDSLSQQELT
jgi:hypothetical protein